MTSLPIKDAQGASTGLIDGSDSWFGIDPNMPVMHQVVVAQLAARRSGTQSTLTRAEVARTGAKSRRQKGGGTSRQGSMRAPQFIGGGVALGPRPRKYNQRTPKKMINLALRSALSDRASEGRIVVVSSWGFSTPKTRDAVKLLAGLGVSGRVLIVLDPTNDADVVAARSFGNIPSIQLIQAGELNAYDVLVSDWVIFTSDTLPVDRPITRGNHATEEASS